MDVDKINIIIGVVQPKETPTIIRKLHFGVVKRHFVPML
jgi:hypothetical protein